MRHVDAGGTAFRRAKDGGVGIGDSFQTRQAGSQNEQAQQKCPVGVNAAGWNEPERAGGNQHEADEDAAFISNFSCNQSGGNRHKKVGEIVGELHEAGLFLVDVERVLKMLVQDVDHPVAKAPQKKQRSDQCKDDEEVYPVSGFEKVAAFGCRV